MSDSPAIVYAETAAIKIRKEVSTGYDASVRYSVLVTSLASHLAAAFSAGVNHAAARFMEDTPGIIQTRVMTHAEADQLRTSLGIDNGCTCINPFFGKDAEPKYHGAACPIFKAHAERERLDTLMDQVAREAFASVNECAATPGESFLVVFADGWWTNTLSPSHWRNPVSSLKIKHFDTAEDLADALRASVHA